MGTLRISFRLFLNLLFTFYELHFARVSNLARNLQALKISKSYLLLIKLVVIDLRQFL